MSNERKKHQEGTMTDEKSRSFNRRRSLLGGASSLVLANILGIGSARAQTPGAGGKKPNIVVLWGDDVGQTNVSAYGLGVMGYRTPNIDRIAKEGMLFTDYYAEQSCTAG